MGFVSNQIAVKGTASKKSLKNTDVFNTLVVLLTAAVVAVQKVKGLDISTPPLAGKP